MFVVGWSVCLLVRNCRILWPLGFDRNGWRLDNDAVGNPTSTPSGAGCASICIHVCYSAHLWPRPWRVWMCCQQCIRGWECVLYVCVAKYQGYVKEKGVLHSVESAKDDPEPHTELFASLAIDITYIYIWRWSTLIATTLILCLFFTKHQYIFVCIFTGKIHTHTHLLTHLLTYSLTISGASKDVARVEEEPQGDFMVFDHDQKVNMYGHMCDMWLGLCCGSRYMCAVCKQCVSVCGDLERHCEWVSSNEGMMCFNGFLEHVNGRSKYARQTAI